MQPRTGLCYENAAPLFKLAIALACLLCVFVLSGCDAGEPAIGLTHASPDQPRASAPESAHMWMSVGERRFAISLADTKAARMLAKQLPLNVSMTELNGNEKYAELPSNLPTEAVRAGTIQSGDVMLYGSATLVVFYKTFSSGYSYTPIGHIEAPEDLETILGSGDVEVRFSSH